MPGESTWIETKQFLEHLGVRIGEDPMADGWVFHGTGGFDFEGEYTGDHYATIYNNIGFTEAKGIVESIIIVSDGAANPVEFQSAWQKFSPQAVMQLYGEPTDVRFWTIRQSIGDRHGYSLWLVYQQWGFIIQYEGHLMEGDLLLVCPRFQEGMDIYKIELYMQSLTNSKSVKAMGGLVDLRGINRSESLPSISSVTLPEFYAMFTQTDQPACFETPAEIWK